MLKPTVLIMLLLMSPMFDCVNRYYYERTGEFLAEEHICPEEYFELHFELNNQGE